MLAVALGILHGAAALPAGAQSGYPARPVKVIVSFPAGGVTDVTVRRIADRFQGLSGQAMVIENRPGRGVAAAAIAAAEPDGYTVGVLGRSHLILHHQLRGALPYAPVDGFTWISALTGSWFGLYVPASSPYRSVADVVAAARANPDGLKYGTAFGHGGLSHVPMDQFERKAGIRMLHVPFRGDNDSIIQMLRSEIDMVVAGGSAMPFVQDGRARLLAWLNPERNPRRPDVPTLRELGYPYEVTAVVGIGGPRGMNPAHVATLERAFQQILAQKDTQDFLERIYQRPDFWSSEKFTAWARAQLAVEKDIVEQFNLADAAPKSAAGATPAGGAPR